MKRLFNIGLGLALGLFSISLLSYPVNAQVDYEVDDSYTTTSDEYDYDTGSYDDYWDESYWEDYDLDSYWDSDYSYDYENDFLATVMGSLGLLFGGVMLVISLVCSLALYIYSGITLMTIAKKLNHSNPWFAWIPIFNMVLLLQLGDKSPWLILLALIPGIGALILAIICVIALMTVCEKRGYDKYLGLLSLVPIANLILLGVLAWGKKA